MVTLKDVAKASGVSLATVSKALNGQSDISEKTAERIKAKAKEMGYLPNSIARTLKTNRSYNIGVLFVDKTSSGFSHDYFSGILNTVKYEAEKCGYDITFISKDIGKHKMDYYEHSKYRQCDGVVIITADFEDDAVLRLVNSEIPVVTLDYTYNNCTSVHSDNASSMEDIISYVYSKGHNKIAFIHGEDTSVTQLRLAGFHKVCKSLSIKVPKEYVKSANYHDPESTAKAVDELLSLKDRPTCILYPDDYSLIGALEVVKKHGYTIPNDLGVVGYDGVFISQIISPKITTFKQNAEEIGKAAIKLLIEEIENSTEFIPKRLVFKGKLIEGESVTTV